MNWNDYFILIENWSISWAVLLLILLTLYIFRFRPTVRNAVTMLTGLVLIYTATGSPVAHLLKFGLHSVAMIQHVIILMVVPLLLWMSLPHKMFSSVRDRIFINNRIAFILSSWLAGTATMWAAHFISAAWISAETGLVICGMSIQADSWMAWIPQWLILALLFMTGMIFLWPVFSQDHRLKLKPLSAVIYLFTACVSCSILGLYVTFTASAAAPVIAHPESPWLMTLRSDQELAGLLMWVPGCMLYVLTSVHITIKWLEGEEKPMMRENWSPSPLGINMKETEPELTNKLKSLNS